MFRTAERVIFGANRLKLLELLVQQHHLSRFRCDWLLCKEQPHFEDHKNFLSLWQLKGEGSWPLGRNPDFLSRGFLNRELLCPTHRILDIACGDGFFDYMFYSGIVEKVDAIDIDQKALELARKFHQSKNITYHLLDAVTGKFPSDLYDIVFWDGAIAHFSHEEIECVMQKIKAVLPGSGVLAGSEALESPERKSYDHRLAMPEPPQWRDYLSRFFPHVRVKEIPAIRGRYREVYFRCGFQPDSLGGCPWS
jgi:SAM-dependent methyltransferase